MLFRSGEEPSGPLLAAEQGWSEILGRRVPLEVIPGSHHNIFNPPGARKMALRAREMLGLSNISPSTKNASESNTAAAPSIRDTVVRVEG